MTPRSGSTTDRPGATLRRALASSTPSRRRASRRSATSRSANLPQYTITASAGAGGSIAPSGAVTVNDGTPTSRSRSRPTRASRSPTCWSTAGRWARSASYTFTNVDGGPHDRGVVRAEDLHDHGDGRRRRHDRAERRGRRATAARTRASRSRPTRAITIADVLVDGVLGRRGRARTRSRMCRRTTRSTRSFAIEHVHDHRVGRRGRLDLPDGRRVPVAAATISVHDHAGRQLRTSPTCWCDGVSVGAVDVAHVHARARPITRSHASFAGSTLHGSRPRPAPDGTIAPPGAALVTCGAEPGVHDHAGRAGYHVAGRAGRPAARSVPVDSVHVHARDGERTRSTRRSRSTRYTITASAGAGGSITPDRRRRSRTTARPGVHDHAGRGLHGADVLVDGDSVGAVAELHVHERDGEPHDRRATLRDHDLRRSRRRRVRAARSRRAARSSVNCGADQAFDDHGRSRATTSPTCWWTVARSAR